MSKEPSRSGEETHRDKRGPLRVILDSNFLITPAEYHIDILQEIPRVLGRSIEPVIPSEVHREIKQISLRSGKRSSLALTLMKKCKVLDTEMSEDERVDDAIVRLAQEWGSPVATNDRVLKRRLRSLGIPVLSMRGKKRLELHGVVD